MEMALRSALISWLRSAPELADINAIEEENPARVSPPWLAISASASRDWSTKDRSGREVRIALELETRGDASAEDSRLANAIERRVATCPSETGPRGSTPGASKPFEIVSIQFLRSRHRKRAGNRRATLLEFRFRVFQTPSE